MGIKRVVDMDFWTDDRVIEEFSPEDKLFFLYLLTNPHSAMLGVYKINPKQMAFEIGYSVEAVKVLIDRFENKYGVIKYSLDSKEIAVKNYLRYGIISGGKPVFDRLSSDMKGVRDLSLLKFVYDSASSRPFENETIKKFIFSLEEYLNKNGYGDGIGDGDGDGESYYDSSHDSCDTADEPPVPPSHSVPYEEIKNLYNTLCPSFPKCTALSDARKKAIKARMSSGYNLDDFKTLFAKAENSSFLKGKNDRNWRASFDWMLKDANMAKVLDGNYDDARGAKPNGGSNGNSEPPKRYGTYV